MIHPHFRPTGHPVADISGFGRSKRLRVRQGELIFGGTLVCSCGVFDGRSTPHVGMENALTGWWFQIFVFQPYLGMIPILTNILQMGWNHQLANLSLVTKGKSPTWWWIFQLPILALKVFSHHFFQNGGCFWMMINPCMKKLVVRKPLWKKWWLDFQGEKKYWWFIVFSCGPRLGPHGLMLQFQDVSSCLVPHCSDRNDLLSKLGDFTPLWRRQCSTNCQGISIVIL